jgi:hypothetical protein
MPTTALGCETVQLVHKPSYKVNDDSLKALGKLIGGKLSAHWDATKATEIKTLASRFVSDNIRALNSLSAMENVHPHHRILSVTCIQS